MSTVKRRPAPSRALPLNLLLDRLRRQGWGPLSGREWKGLRAVLQGLVSRVDFRTGWGTTTIEQVASAACYGLRWTREQLYVLEDMGLIEWERGGVRAGRPVPSRIHVIREALAMIVDAACDQRTAEMVAHAAATRQRLAGLRRPFVSRHRKTKTARSRGSSHVAVAAYPTPKGAAPGGLRPQDDASRTPVPPPPGRPEPSRAGIEAARAALRALGRDIDSAATAYRPRLSQVV